MLKLSHFVLVLCSLFKTDRDLLKLKMKQLIVRVQKPSFFIFFLFVPNMLLISNYLSAQNQEYFNKLIEKKSKEIEKKLIEWRRDLHKNPELGEQEVRTANLIANHLKSLGMEVKTGVAVTGVVGVLKGGKPGPVVALRADMDALPVQEQVDIPFASKAKGLQLGKEMYVMHACGHDAHMAILMATAEILAGIKDQLPGSVKFIFQPAEEGPSMYQTDGVRIWGAKKMVQEGVLENPKVDAIFGLHVFSTFHSGVLAWRSGPIMAASDFLGVNIKGIQTHGSTPWQGADPIVSSAQIINGLQTVVSRQMDITKEPAVVTVATVQGGTRNNIIPDEVDMTGTIRTFDEDMRDDIHQKIKYTIEKLAEGSGTKADVKIIRGYNVTNNDPQLTEKMSPTLRRVAGTGNYIQSPKITGAEDFSYFQEKVPGLFLFLGVTPKDKNLKQVPSNHSPLFYIDESALIVGVRALTNLTVDYMLLQQKK